MRSGQELNVAVRLQLPAWTPNQEILSVRLAWDGPGSSERQQRIEHLTLPVMESAEIAELPQDEAVAEEFAVFAANRARRRALEELDRGDVLAAETTLRAVAVSLSSLKPSFRTTRELQLLNEKQALLNTDRKRARKGLSRESLRSSLDVWEADDQSQP